MNKTLLIFRHEFRHTIKRTGFIIMTLIVPLIALLAIGIYQIVSGIARPAVEEAVTIGYIDESGEFQQYTNWGNITLVRFGTTDEANRALVGSEIEEYFVIPADYINTGVINRFTLKKQVTAPPATEMVIKNFLSSNLLSGKVSQATIDRIRVPLYLVTTRLTETGAVAPEQGGYENVIIPAIFSLLLVLSITFASSYLLSGLGDEKESRLIEVLLSSVSTRQLIIGKVFGIGVAGLVQVLVWVVSIPLLLSLASSTIGGFISTIQLPANFLVWGILYFILGYLLFAVISTGIGAITPSAREGQQLATIFTLAAVSPLWFSSLMLIFPDAPVWIVLTIFPLTAPVVMMLRLGSSDVAAWQIAASLVVMLLTITGGLLLTSRIVRTYLLMYGKRPNLSEIMRSLRNT